MRTLIYAMGVSLDGYTAGPDGSFGWSAPDDALHRFHNEQARATSLELYGRGMYETMRAWEAADGPGWTDTMREFARVWQATPKLVFSRTLERVSGNARLAGGDLVEQVTRLRAGDGGAIAVGGPGLASTLLEHDLVDELRLFVSPVLVGGGTRFFPEHAAQRPLALLETRTFASRVVYLRYARVRD